MRRSHLTLRIFRRLLSPQGLEFRCRAQLALITRKRPGNTCPSLLRSPARRSIWGFSKKPEKQIREAELDPGLETMLELSEMIRMKTRPPPAADLVAAWKKFFSFKRRKGLVVNNIQAKHVLRTFRHLRDTNTGEEGFGLAMSDINSARDSLLAIPSDGTEEHAILARELYHERQRRSTNKEVQDQAHYERDSLIKLVIVLTRTGYSSEARDLTRKLIAKEKHPRSLALYTKILVGFAKEGNEAELLATYDMSQTDGAPYTERIRNTMTSFYAARNDVESTKLWYARPYTKEAYPYPCELLSVILKFSIRNNELDWCRTVFRDAVNSNPEKRAWDVILQWAAGVEGKGVEEVEQVMKIMQLKSTEKMPTVPDSKTINGLIQMAMENGDPYTAERYTELGRKFGISPDAGTFIQQIKYRAAKGDLTGAQSAYQKLQAEELSQNDDLPAINEYLRALCSARGNNYDRIRSVMADLEERNVRLEAATTGSLSIMYMERDELHDALDVLQANSWHYSLAERDSIREAFTAFCLNPENGTVRIWDAYTIMREVFNEADRDVRTKIMNEFFRRERCDMACYTFGHMRQNIDANIRPVAETYVQCLQGIAHLADAEQLDMVHNMLKMDSSIEPSTKLYNALMLAYAECDDADRAVEFWDDITNSIEGPTYNSLVILFRACELKPFAEKLAMDTWDKMKRMDIEVTKDVFISYLAALAGRAQMDEGKKLVEGMERNYGFQVDVPTLCMFYNSTMGQDRREQVQEWAKRLYPEIWTEVTHLGRFQHEEGYLLFKMPKRQLKA